jgi:hypothetical protein
MLSSDVSKFLAAFAVVTATAGTVWIVAAIALPSQPSRAGDPSAAIDQSAAQRRREQVPAAERPSQNVDPDSLRSSLRAPLWIFHFGFELDRM